MKINFSTMEDRKKTLKIDENVVKVVDEVLEKEAKAMLELFNNIAPYQEPFIEKPRKKRRQHLFKR